MFIQMRHDIRTYHMFQKFAGYAGQGNLQLLRISPEYILTFKKDVQILRPSQGFWGFRECYLFSGILGEGSFIYRDLGEKAWF